MAGSVSAVLIPDVQFMEENAAELGTVLGARLGQPTAEVGRKHCDSGELLARLLPGNESLGMKFFDWQRPAGKGYQVGVLKPAAEIAAFVLGRKIDPALEADKAEAMGSRILINVEKFRAACGG
jgi:hypothetical protein